MSDTPAPVTHRKRAHDEQEAPKNDFRALIMHVQNHPGAYLGAIGFIVMVMIVTGVYRLTQKASLEEASTEFARAIDQEDPAARAEALKKIVDARSPLTPRALYLQGESELEAGNTDAARDAFTKLRETYPDYEFVPEAVEGLGLMQEDAGNFAKARGMYEEISSKWPDSVAAQRQPFNIARCLEGEKNFPGAIEKYRKQLEVFPGSTVAVRSQQRLDELRVEHPDLFPAENAALDTLKPATDAAPAATPEASAAPAENPAPAPSATGTPETAPATPPAPQQ